MSHTAGRPSRSEGRRRSRSDADEGGRYVGIPRNDHSTRSISRPPVHCPENRVRYTSSCQEGGEHSMTTDGEY